MNETFNQTKGREKRKRKDKMRNTVRNDCEFINLTPNQTDVQCTAYSLNEIQISILEFE